jgi:predicted nucleic acid-binding protein
MNPALQLAKESVRQNTFLAYKSSSGKHKQVSKKDMCYEWTVTATVKAYHRTADAAQGAVSALSLLETKLLTAEDAAAATAIRTSLTVASSITVKAVANQSGGAGTS